MKRIALVAAGVAVAGAAACTHAAAPAASPAGHGGTRVPVSCAHQYHEWEAGPGKGSMAALSAVAGTSAAGDSKALAAALRTARSAVARGARHPVPACADPRGYWDVLMMHVNAAAAGNNSAPAIRTALRGVPQIEDHLTTEIKSAVSTPPARHS